MATPPSRTSPRAGGRCRPEAGPGWTFRLRGTDDRESFARLHLEVDACSTSRPSAYEYVAPRTTRRRPAGAARPEDSGGTWPTPSTRAYEARPRWACSIHCSSRSSGSIRLLQVQRGRDDVAQADDAALDEEATDE